LRHIGSCVKKASTMGGHRADTSKDGEWIARL